MKTLKEMKVGDVFWSISAASKPEQYEYYSTKVGEDCRSYYVKDLNNPDRRFMLAANIHDEMDNTRINTMGAPFYTTREECRKDCIMMLERAIESSKQELEFYNKSLEELKSEK